MPHSLEFEHRALIVMISALFFLVPVAFARDAGLAEALYMEGDWRGARAEALRITLSEPEHHAATLIYALASLQLDPEHEESSLFLRQSLQVPDLERDQRAWATYEFGRILWQTGNETEAYTWLRRAFLEAQNYELFLQAAYALNILLIRYPDLAGPEDLVRAQARTVWGLIPPAIRQLTEPPPRMRTARMPNPGAGLVRFYQTQIGPAIGQRCSMHPSCSTYCMEAIRQYGLLAIPLTADRLIRETDHVNHRINPIKVNGQEKYYDPVPDQTFWFRRQRR